MCRIQIIQRRERHSSARGAFAEHAVAAEDKGKQVEIADGFAFRGNLFRLFAGLDQVFKPFGYGFVFQFASSNGSCNAMRSSAYSQVIGLALCHSPCMLQ